MELRNLLVTRHDPSTFPKIGIDTVATTVWSSRSSKNVFLKKFAIENLQ